MTGRHEGKADNLAVIVGGLLGILGFLAFLAWLIYLMVIGVHISRLSQLIIGAIAFLIWVVLLIIRWRDDKRFPLAAAFILLPAFYFARGFAPSWPWLNWVNDAVSGMTILIVARAPVYRWWQHRMERRLNP
jgi:hypothetical protein